MKQWHKILGMQLPWENLEAENVKVRFQVFMAAKMKATLFWNIVPSSVVEIYWSLRDLYDEDTHYKYPKMLPNYTEQHLRRQ